SSSSTGVPSRVGRGNLAAEAGAPATEALPLPIHPSDPGSEVTAMKFARSSALLFLAASAVRPAAAQLRWVHLTPGASPPARGAAAMAYDPVHKDLVLF